MQELRSYKGFNSSTYALYTAAFPWCNFYQLFFGTSHIIGLSINIIKSLATIAISRTRAIPCLYRLFDSSYHLLCFPMSSSVCAFPIHNGWYKHIELFFKNCLKFQKSNWFILKSIRKFIFISLTTFSSTYATIFFQSTFDL